MFTIVCYCTGTHRPKIVNRITKVVSRYNIVYSHEVGENTTVYTRKISSKVRLSILRKGGFQRRTFISNPYRLDPSCVQILRSNMLEWCTGFTKRGMSEGKGRNHPLRGIVPRDESLSRPYDTGDQSRNYHYIESLQYHGHRWDIDHENEFIFVHSVSSLRRSVRRLTLTYIGHYWFGWEDFVPSETSYGTTCTANLSLHLVWVNSIPIYITRRNDVSDPFGPPPSTPLPPGDEIKSSFNDTKGTKYFTGVYTSEILPISSLGRPE